MLCGLDLDAKDLSSTPGWVAIKWLLLDEWLSVDR